MDQAITIGDLLAGAGLVVGIIVAVGGALVSFGAGMASSPTDDSNRTGRRGCQAIIIGLVVAAYCAWTLFR